MAMNAWEARQMWDAARARPDLVTQIVPSPFSLHVDKTIQRLIREGYLGDILAIEVNASNGNFLDPQGPLHWRHDFDLSGYNIMALGIWYEALMRWVGTAKTVTANGKTFVNQRKDAESGSLKSIQIPDRLAVLADMVCGAQASLLLSDVDGGVSRFEAVLYGSEGTIRFANGELSGIRQGDNGFSPISIPDEEKGEWQVEAEFIQAIRGQRVVTHTTFADGVKYMEFTEAVSRSMLENKTISLPLSPQS
jgi:predicted dehydrogenase